MRLLTSLAATLALSSAFVPDAPACGFDPRPAALRVTSHFIPGAGTRSFVVIGDAPTLAESAWRQLAPSSYDGTRIADLPELAAPYELTLVGPSGTRHVSTTHEVALAGDWIAGSAPHAALEIAVQAHDDFQIALRGNVEATWHDVRQTYASTDVLDGTDVRIGHVKDGFSVERAGITIATSPGRALGAVDVAGMRYIVVERARGSTATLAIGTAARAIAKR